jgi:hypothetical protein
LEPPQAGLSSRQANDGAIYSGSTTELTFQAPVQFRAKFGYGHPRNHPKFTAQHRTGLVFAGDLAGNAAVLTFLIPAKTAVGDGVWTDELKAAQDRILFRYLEGFAEDGDLD